MDAVQRQTVVELRHGKPPNFTALPIRSERAIAETLGITIGTIHYCLKKYYKENNLRDLLLWKREYKKTSEIKTEEQSSVLKQENPHFEGFPCSNMRIFHNVAWDRYFNNFVVNFKTVAD